MRDSCKKNALRVRHWAPRALETPDTWDIGGPKHTGRHRASGTQEVKLQSQAATPWAGASRLELTLRAHEVGVRRTFIDTSKTDMQRWRPPLVDADWHAVCQAVYQGIEGPEWEAMYFTCEDLHQAVKNKKSAENS